MIWIVQRTTVHQFIELFDKKSHFGTIETSSSSFSVIISGRILLQIPLTMRTQVSEWWVLLDQAVPCLHRLNNPSKLWVIVQVYHLQSSVFSYYKKNVSRYLVVVGYARLTSSSTHHPVSRSQRRSAVTTRRCYYSSNEVVTNHVTLESNAARIVILSRVNLSVKNSWLKIAGNNFRQNCCRVSSVNVSMMSMCFNLCVVSRYKFGDSIFQWIQTLVLSKAIEHLLQT